MKINPLEAIKSIKALLSMEVALEIMELENGTKIEAEKFEPDYQVFIVNDSERVALPVGEYKLMDGKILTVEQEGVIASVKEAQAPADQPAPDQPAPEAPELEANGPKKTVESQTISKETFFSAIEDLKKELREEFEAKLSSLKPIEDHKPDIDEKAEVELSEDPKPEVNNPEEKVEREVTLFAQKRRQTMEQRVFEKLFKN